MKIISIALFFSILLSGIVYCSQGLPASIGQKGIEDGCFDCPKDVAIDSKGNIYVLDDQNARVQKFGPDGTFLKKWGSKGRGPGQFSGQYSNLECIAIDRYDRVYITDGNHRVQIFDTEGNFLKAWNYRGFAIGQFQSTVGIAIDKSGNVFVADYVASKILKFSKDGVFIKEWGGAGHGDGQLWGAWDVATDNEGNVFVTEYWNNRVSEFTNDGTFIRTWGRQGTGDGQFSHPEGIVADALGNVYVADNGNNNVQRFSPKGEFICKWDNTQDGYGFQELAGLALDKNGNLYVANYRGYNVVIIKGVAQPQPAEMDAQPTLVDTQPTKMDIQPTGMGTRPTIVDITGQALHNPLYRYGLLCGCPLAIVIFALCVYLFTVLRREMGPGDLSPENQEPHIYWRR